MVRIPKHHTLELENPLTVDFDEYYKAGWKPIQISAHPDGEQVFILFEKIPISQK